MFFQPSEVKYIHENDKAVESSTDLDVLRIADLSLGEDKENINILDGDCLPQKHMKGSTAKKTPKAFKSKDSTKSTGLYEENKSLHRINALESYFLHNDKSHARRKTSDHTLSLLRVGDSTGLPDPVTFEKLRSCHKPVQLNISQNLRLHLSKQLFGKWKIYLREGFNILLYGIGSKRPIIEDFREQYLKNSNCIVVPGYDLSTNIRQILNFISYEFLQISESCRSPTEQLQHICELFTKDEAERSPLYLLIHNIDGPGLRNAKAQNILARLAGIKHIHMVASLDHVNTPILWSHNELAYFSWIWEDCTTFYSYNEETNYSNSQILQNLLGGLGSGADTVGNAGTMLASLRQVAASLTQNARDIFRMVAEYQLEVASQNVKSTTNGMSLEDLYWRCRDAFLTSSEATLRAQLTEFRDHKLIKLKKSSDGTESIYIPIDDDNLQKMVKSFDSLC